MFVKNSYQKYLSEGKTRNELVSISVLFLVTHFCSAGLFSILKSLLKRFFLSSVTFPGLHYEVRGLVRVFTGRVPDFS